MEVDPDNPDTKPERHQMERTFTGAPWQATCASGQQRGAGMGFVVASSRERGSVCDEIQQMEYVGFPAHLAELSGSAGRS